MDNSKTSEKTSRMGTAPMLKLIFTMSLPAMFSMLVQSLYNVVDSMFIANFSSDAFTAINLAFPLQMLMISVAVGTGIGINSVVARSLGEGNVKKASSAATHGVFLGAISGVVFAIIGFLIARPFFTAFISDTKIIQYGVDYIYIVFGLSIGSLMQINIEKTLQATGNMIYPMLFQLTGAIVNIILDPIMIFGLLGFPALGMKGAAIATVIGQFSALIFSMIILHTKSHDVHIKIKGFKFKGETVKSIYAVGVPSIIMQSLGSIIVMAFNNILLGFSAAAVNALGAYSKIQSFVFMPVFGLTQGIMPIMGYNYGARNRKRLTDALKYGIIIAGIIMALGMLMFLIIPDKLLMIFGADEEMMRVGVTAFRLLSLCFIPAAVGIVSSTLFQAVGMGNKSLIISVLRQFVILLPLAYLLAQFGVNYVWLSFPIAEASALVVAVIFIIHTYKKNIDVLMPKKLTEVEEE